MEYRTFGPPGTGKTTWLAKQVRLAAESHGSDSLMVASFTRGAARELVSRDLPVDPQRVGTLHAHCYRALNGGEIAETHLNEWNDAHPTAAMTPGGRDTDDPWTDGKIDVPKKGDEYYAHYQSLRARMVKRDLWPDSVDSFATRWEDWKLNEGYIDFTDMLEHAYRDFDCAPWAPSVGFFDEAQDFTRLELALVRKWGEQMEFFILVGDEDQCHPAGTKILTSNRGYVPIEKLDSEDDRLVCCDFANGDDEIRRKGFRFRVASREYGGLLVRAYSSLSDVWMTPDHRIIIKWRPEAIGKKCVYLMRSGNGHGWRIGTTDIVREKAGGRFGPGIRARQEGAEALWILTACNSEREALLLEDELSVRFGISKMVFKSPTCGQLLKHGQNSLNKHHDDICRFAKPLELLMYFGRSYNHPFWVLDGRQRGIATRQEIRACNIVNGVMDIPTRRIPHQKFVEWVQVSKHSKISNPAPVYSLDVERYHNYIAEKQVVMNCIYSFKGATPDAFLKPELPHEQIRVLSQSYRLPRAVHAFAEKWIRRVTERMEKRYAPTDQEGEIKRNNHASWLHPDRLLTEIIQEIDEGRRVMILTSCSFMLSPVIKMLRNAGIPFCNPFQRKRGYWNPLRSGKGMSMRERLLALLRINEEVYGSDSRMWTRRELSKIIDVIDAKSGVLVRGAKTRAAKLAKLDGRLEVTAGELTSVFDPEAFDRFMWQTDCSHADWLERHMLKSKAKTMQYPLTIFRKRGIKALQDMPQVILGTIHSAKGGEADVVYIFPDLSRAGVLEYHKSRQGKEAVMRQFYVGFTRAKRRLVLCQAASELAVQF